MSTHVGSVWLPDRKASLRWHTVGEGRPLVLLPGLSLAAVSQFLPLATHPAMAGRRLVMLDYVGSGFSDHARHDGTPESHADDVEEALKALDLSGVDIFGHSMGGTVAIALAAHCPARVGRLVVAEANLVPGGGAATRTIAASTPEDWAKTDFDQLLAKLREAGRNGSPMENFIAANWSLASARSLHANSVGLVDLGNGFLDQFLSLPQPRTFIFGDQNVPKAGADGTADAPTPDTLKGGGVTVSIIPDAGHMMMHDNPDAFAHALAAALPL